MAYQKNKTAIFQEALKMNPCDCDVVIVGAGPAGLSAAVNAASELPSVIVVEGREIGGQAVASKAIENFVGFPEGITGKELMGRALQQASKFGVDFRCPQMVESISCQDGLVKLTMETEEELTCRACIVTVGLSYRILSAKGLGMFQNRGLMYCGIPTPSKGNHVIVGAGNSAGQAALFLASKGCEVTMLVRGDNLEKSMSRYLIGRISNSSVRVMFHTEITEARGGQELEELVLAVNGQEQTMAAKTVNVFIGAVPKTRWLKGSSVALNERGFILTGGDIPNEMWKLDRHPLAYETTLPGVFAAGDARFGSVKRVAAAVGEGSGAVSSVHQLFTFNGK